MAKIHCALLKLRATAALLMLIAVVRVALTWTTFSQTADEPAHIAAGMELLAQHRYTVHIENTPLPRIVLTVIPWLSGTEYQPNGSITDQGNSVLYSRGDYLTNLVRVRAGNLFFLVLAMLFTWLWARKVVGDLGGVVALFFLSTQPAILGHAGLATSDMAAVAGLAASLYAWSRWLDSPTFARALIAGAAYGFAVNCKLSCIAFVPAAWAVGFGVRWLATAFPFKARHLLTIALTAAIVVWAGYGFRVGSMASILPVSPEIVSPRIASIPLPAPHFFRGIVKVMETDRRGHPAYLLGMSSLRGWWWYFPAALLLKSTLPLLVGAVAAFMLRLRKAAEPAGAGLGILLVAMTSHLNLGIRHLLPIFAPLAVVAAVAVIAAMEKRRLFALLLVAWQALTGFAHPDYLPYFNELAVREPSRYLLDSNLDWGQDLLRLEAELRTRKVREFGFKYFGPADLKRHNLPPWTEIRMDRPQKGWIAISEMFYNGVWYDGYHPRRYPWLVDRKPVAYVGKSIRLYFIP